MPIVLSVDARSGVPIYLQLIEQIKRSVALGVLQPAERLPTVKQLALDLTINPNTVARSYRDLERDGVIETSPGRGSFVRGDGTEASVKAAAGDVAQNAIEAAVREAKSLGLSRAEASLLIEGILDRWYPEKS
ncbi:MAG: GntR family transcriptional regulator [Vulcanimicrobiaceae bacterium]